MISLVKLITVLFAMVAISHGDEQAVDTKLKARWIGGGLGFGGSSYSSFSSSFSASSFYSGYNLGVTPWLMNTWGGFYGGGANIFGYGILPSLYSPMLFAKDDDTHSVSRRAISLDSDQLFRRAEHTVSCINAKGNSEQFVKSDCLKAADKLAQEKVSSASCGLCKLSLVTPHSRIAPKQIPASAFEKTAHGILKACSTRNHVKRSGSSTGSKEDVAMVLSKSASPTAC